MGEETMEVLANRLDAEKMVHFDNTVAVLTDSRPGLDMNAVHEICAFLRSEGYFIRTISVEEFMQKDLSFVGAMLLIPHAQSTPIEMSNALQAYWKQGGRVLLLGGPIFGSFIEKEEGEYREKDISGGALDAAHAIGDTFIMEGIAPTHKVFIEKSVQSFRTEEDQYIFQGTLQAADEDVACPVARPHGIGYSMEHNNRFIPLVSAMGEGGRADGRRGAAAFLMLSDTRGHLRRTNGVRPGSVSATTQGSCAGVIGLRRQDLMGVDGFPELLSSMLGSMRRGIWLYEGGADRFVVRPGEEIHLGAKVLSLSQDFQRAEITIRVQCAGRERVIERELLVSARSYTQFEEKYVPEQAGDYTIHVELRMQGENIDCITQELRVIEARRESPERCVRVEGDHFVCDGKPWYPYGTNYWPLFYPSFEREDYWMGWLDKANYDPLETERDLSQLAQRRTNLICTRLDGDVLGRSMETLRDFVERCRRHGLRLMLSWVNASNPFYYQPEAMEALLRRSGLIGDPVLFSHDISWETGPQAFSYIDLWDGGWEKWIIENYGSVENAEKEWEMPLDRDSAGRATHPPREQLSENGPWRKKVCAYRRYVDRYVSRKWNDAVRHLRAIDPCHLITYRSGIMTLDGGMYLTGSIKHVDFTALEGYTFEQNPEGQGGMVCWSLLARKLSGGKPVTWVEYGLSLIGMSGRSTWEALRWDRKNLSPYPEMLDRQTEYNQMFFDMFREAGVVGSAPWWYAGGFRRVELSDCGYVSPNGVPRPVWDAYLAMADWFLQEREKREVSETITLDADATAQSYGRYCLGSGMVNRMTRDAARVAGQPVPDDPDWGEGAIACRDAMREGRHVDFTTPGIGTTSLTMPMVAVGNTPLNGHNPPRYLDAEFNAVAVIANGMEIPVENGGTVTVPKGEQILLKASVGNLREAKWLKAADNGKGSVCLHVQTGAEESRLPIEEDTEYLADASVCAALPGLGSRLPVTVTLRMEAVGISRFGEVYSFSITAKNEG